MEKASEETGILTNNINPFMVAVKILQINRYIYEKFPLSRISIESYQQDLISKVKFLLDLKYICLKSLKASFNKKIYRVIMCLRGLLN